MEEENSLGHIVEDEALRRCLDWISQPEIDEATRGELIEMKEDPVRLREHFGDELHFGTGGMRGIIGPGLNRINRYTVRRATQGLANYILAQNLTPERQKVALAYDTRRFSREFAREAAEVLAGNGVQALLFAEVRPTPQLSFAVRELNCAAGIVITASHNPPQYNGYKVYGPDGGQAVSELVDRLTEAIAAVDIFRHVQSMDYGLALSAGLVKIIGPEMDRSYLKVVRSQSLSRPGSRIKVVYTPLHGAGADLIPALLKREPHADLTVVPEQMVADPQFATVRVPNPEDPASFKMALELASRVGAELIVATDPDADRMGCVLRGDGGGYIHLSGNQIGALLIEYILSRLSAEGKLPGNGVVVKTIVTGELGRKIARAYGVDTEETLTGFKFIGEKIREYELTGRRRFLFGYEESNGFLAGTYTRDKDAVAGTFLMIEMAAYYRDKGLSLLDILEQLYLRHGYFREDLVSVELKSMAEADLFLAAFSDFSDLPGEIEGVRIVERRDYSRRLALNLLTGEKRELALPQAQVLCCLLEDGAWFCVRPSGTEPKIKIYFSVQGASAAQAQEKISSLKKAVLAIPDPELFNAQT